MLKAGATLGSRYEIVGRIGSGGMADVYKAKDGKLNRYVAVKVMKAEFKNDNNFVAKFTREAQAAAGLANPNIVNVFDVGDDNGVYYIVMELVEGITLKEYINKKVKLTVREATSIAIQVCMGLSAAHAHGIIHRDVKPQNIIISTDGKVKVTDFGIARAVSSNTISANAMGSVHYSSPEQVRGGFADAKSDIYSLGITMYEMVTGRVPFDGDSTVAIAIKHLQDEMEPPSKYAEGLPYSLEQIIYKCTQKSAERRYNSVDEVIEDLKHSLIDPNGHFVQLTPLTTHAQTIMMSPAEMAAIKAGTAAKADSDDDSRVREVYNSTASAKKNADTKAKAKVYDLDDDDDDDDDDYEAYKAARRARNRRDDDDDDDDEGGLEKALTIGGFIVGALIICILIYFIGRAAGIFHFGSGSKDKASSAVSIESSVEDETPSVEMIPVPSIIGMTEQEAQTVLTNLGLGIKYQGEENSDTIAPGLVSRQDPESGTKVEANTIINYYRSSGASTKAIPNVTGKSLSEAQSELSANGFTNINIEQAASDTVGINNVISVTPGVGESVDVGTTIILTVSTGPAPAPSPDEGGTVVVNSWTGLTQELATQLAQESGLTVVYSQSTGDTCAIGEVLTQSIEPGTEVPRGSTITFVINTAPENIGAAGTPSEPRPDQGQTEATNTGSGSNWTCNQRLGAPSNYTGGAYRLTLEQNGQEKTIVEGASIAFPYELKTTGAAGVSSGKVHLYESVNGNYVIRANWEVPFSES